MTAALLVGGSLLILLAGIGMLRFPDTYTRISATSKAATLGVALVLLAAAWHFATLPLAGRALVTVGFIYLTAPLAGHRIGRAAYRSGSRAWERTAPEELARAESAAATPDPPEA